MKDMGKKEPANKPKKYYTLVTEYANKELMKLTLWLQLHQILYFCTGVSVVCVIFLLLVTLMKEFRRFRQLGPTD